MDGQRSFTRERIARCYRNRSFVFLIHVTSIADAVTIRIQLVGVHDGRAVVRVIENIACRLLAVLNRLVGVTEPILIKVGVVSIDALITVRKIRTVVFRIGNTVTVTIHPFRKGLNEHAVYRRASSVVGYGKGNHVGSGGEGLGDNASCRRTRTPVPLVVGNRTVRVVGGTRVQVDP